MRGVRRLPFDRLLHDPGPLPAADRGNPSTAGSVLFDSPEAIFNETMIRKRTQDELKDVDMGVRALKQYGSSVEAQPRLDIDG